MEKILDGVLKIQFDSNLNILKTDKQTNEVVPHINLPPQPVRLKGTGNKKKLATCLVTLLKKELNSDVAQQIRLLTDLNVGGKTHNIAFQLVSQQCCKTKCTFFLPVIYRSLINGT